MHILVNRIRLNNFGLEWCKIKILEFHQVHEFSFKNIFQPPATDSPLLIQKCTFETIIGVELCHECHTFVVLTLKIGTS